MRYLFALLLLAAVGVVATGCGDDDIVRPGGSGLAEVAIAPGDDGFTVTVARAYMDGRPVDGPFVIEGRNIVYNAFIGALLVDLTVRNAGSHTYPLPAHLEFVLLAPPGTTVRNPDNGETGVGAQVGLHFSDRDVVWSPGEVSQPRSIQFGVDEGVSVGFGLRIRVGPDVDLGAIGGVVFYDADEDGKLDPGEGGVALRTIHLAWTDSLYDCIPGFDCPFYRTTTTDVAGEYRFDGLRAGFYTVTIERDRCSIHTTPTELKVILVENDGTVSDFPWADFGVVTVRECP